MNDVVVALNGHEALSLTWRLVVWACVAYLLVVGLMALLRPALAGRFLDGFAASQRANAAEAALRLVAGLGLMGASPAMKFSMAFFWFGALLAATALPMMFLHGLHRRYAGWAIPFAKRILGMYGVMALALSGVIVWSLV
jgi:hypothetical protein